VLKKNKENINIVKNFDRYLNIGFLTFINDINFIIAEAANYEFYSTKM